MRLSINAEFIVIKVSVDKSDGSIQTNLSIYAQDYLELTTAGLEHEKTSKSTANEGKNMYAPALNYSLKYAALSVDLSFSSEGHIVADMRLTTERDAGLHLACYIERGTKRFFPKDEPWYMNPDDISTKTSDPVLCDFNSSFDLYVNRYEPATFYLEAQIGPSGSMPIRYDKIWIEVEIYEQVI